MAEVKYITYRGKEHPIRVKYWANKKFKDEIGMNFGGEFEYDGDGRIKSVEGKEFTIEHYELLLYFALKAGKKAVDDTLEIDFSKEDMEFVLDECLYEFMEEVREFSAEMMKAQGIDPDAAKDQSGNLNLNREQRRNFDRKKQVKK